MRYWYDSEFLDTGSTIELVSIGMVAEDGRELYLQSVEFDPEKANDWVKRNVFPHLIYCSTAGKNWGKLGSFALSKVYHQGIMNEGQRTPNGQCDRPECPWRTREQIRDEVLAFVNAGEGNPEFIGSCAGYDWVALCQLFGTMMDIPGGWPHYVRDLQHILDDRGILDGNLPPQEGSAHNALDDARHLKKLWGYIVRQASKGGDSA